MSRLTDTDPPATPASPLRSVVVTGLFFLSGVAGLTLQVVWMYRLGLVFGNAAYATAATLASFFLGLAIGGWLWGKWAARLRRPLTVYGLMELGVALTALLWIPGLEFYEGHYASIVSLVGQERGLILSWKVISSTSLMLLPAVLMGGTFPVLAQHVGAGSRLFTRRATLLYAVNTLGASLGALLAGFYLLSAYGVNYTYGLAVGLAAVTGLAALGLDLLPSAAPPPSPLKSEDAGRLVTGGEMSRSDLANPSLGRRETAFLAFCSGFLALSLETLWTRMLAQVLQNSVYSFSATVVVFLVALGVGGLLAHAIARSSLPSVPALVLLLSVGAVFVGLSPLVLSWQTDGLQYLASDATWGHYLRAVFSLGMFVLFAPTVVIGAVFPLLLKASWREGQRPGRFVGRLVLYNSLGAALGPVLAGFVLLDALGLWVSLKVAAVAYALLALFVIRDLRVRTTAPWAALPIASLVVVLSLSEPAPVPLAEGETTLASWPSSDGVVSVVQSSENIQMRLDNYYVLGDSRSVLVEEMQAHIALLPHPEPKKVLFLGLGTGITAGAALGHDVERVVAVELVPNVVRAAEQYFSPWTNGLFQDPRVEIIADDARNFLLGTDELFDVIVGDLFTPWHAGTGSLYTIEHFEQGKSRLAPDGIFAQWLPLYQLTRDNFDTIAATFSSVFPVVTVWRADFSESRASVVLMGQELGARLDEDVLRRNIVGVVGQQEDDGAADHMTGLFYLGNLTSIQDRLEGITTNTDDRRTVEFAAPISSQQANAGRGTYIVGRELDLLLGDLSGVPQEDPYLANLPASELLFIEVGRLYHSYLGLVSAGNESEAESTREQIRLLAPDFLE